MHDFPKFGVLLLRRGASYDLNESDIGGLQALAQNALPDHASCTKQQNVHRGFPEKRFMGLKPF
jgi:hypothetical protein